MQSSLSSLLRSQDFARSLDVIDTLLIARLINIQLEVSGRHDRYVEIAGIFDITNEWYTTSSSLSICELNPFTFDELSIIVEDGYVIDEDEISLIVIERSTGEKIIRCKRTHGNIDDTMEEDDSDLDVREWNMRLEKITDNLYIGEERCIIDDEHMRDEDVDIEFISEDEGIINYKIECHLIDELPITCYISKNYINIIESGNRLLFNKMCVIEDISIEDYSLNMIRMLEMMIEKYWKQ